MALCWKPCLGGLKDCKREKCKNRRCSCHTRREAPDFSAPAPDLLHLTFVHLTFGHLTFGHLTFGHLAFGHLTFEAWCAGSSTLGTARGCNWVSWIARMRRTGKHETGGTLRPKLYLSTLGLVRLEQHPGAAQ